jgi:hypothetical protein
LQVLEQQLAAEQAKTIQVFIKLQHSVLLLCAFFLLSRVFRAFAAPSL